MVKIIIGFVILAVAALFVLKNASHVDLGGEHSAQEAMQKAQDAPTDPNKADPSKRPRCDSAKSTRQRCSRLSAD